MKHVLGALALLGLYAACGGEPLLDDGTVGPAGGSVTSSDGRVRLTLAPNAVSAATRIGIEPDGPSPARPAFVSGSAYRFHLDQPLVFPLPQRLEMNPSGALVPRNVTLQNAADDTLASLGLATCDHALAYQTGIPLKTLWYPYRTDCPANCTELEVHDHDGSGADKVRCAPSDTIVIAPSASCPTPYAPLDVSGLEELGIKYCRIDTAESEPSVVDTEGAVGSCSVGAGVYTCAVANLHPGAFWLETDTSAPSTTLLIENPEVIPDASGHGTLDVTLLEADDPGGTLAKLELRELVSFSLQLTEPAASAETKVLYDTPKNGLVGSKGRATHVSIPYLAGERAERWVYPRAVDAAGNVRVGALVRIHRGAAAADTQKPIVTAFSTNPVTLQAPGTTKLTATATDNVAVTAVEFSRSGTVIATDTTPADGFTHEVALTATDAGGVTFGAVALDAAGNRSDMLQSTVTLVAISPNDRYVALTGDDANPGTQAAPFKTLAKGTSSVPSGATVWVHAGTYDRVTEGVSNGNYLNVNVPDGVSMRALSGAVTVHGTVHLLGSGNLGGLTLQPELHSASIVVQGGGVVGLSGVTLAESGSCGSGIYALTIDGAAQVTLDPGANPDHDYAGANVTGFARVGGTARLHVAGGVVDGAAPTGCSGSAVFEARGSGLIELSGVRMTNTYLRAFSVHGGARLRLVNSTLDEMGPTNGAFGVAVHPGGRLDAIGSTFRNISGHAVFVDSGAGANPILTFDTCTFSHALYGVQAATTPVDLTMIGTTLEDIELLPLGVAGGTVSVQASTFRRNGEARTNYFGFAGALDAGSPTSVVALQVRGSTFDRNGSAAMGPYGALVLGGAAGSSFDLGTAASPGNNTFTNNPTYSLHLKVPAGVTVQAAGNTWAPGIQGSDANGRYTAASPTCSEIPCEVVSGSGLNYFVTSGVLRLVDAP